jgi:PIN domain nuclease of toxin-antitoxin system
MKILLDTHVFIWALIDETRLSPRARKLISSSSLLWSVVSLWEAIQKAQIGKLSLPLPAGSFLTGELSSHHVQLVPVSLGHVLRLESLPLHHRDPFDRLLIAQSIEEGWPIITADPLFARYPVEVIW